MLARWVVAACVTFAACSFLFMPGRLWTRSLARIVSRRTQAAASSTEGGMLLFPPVQIAAAATSNSSGNITYVPNSLEGGMLLFPPVQVLQLSSTVAPNITNQPVQSYEGGMLLFPPVAINDSNAGSAQEGMVIFPPVLVGTPSPIPTTTLQDDGNGTTTTRTTRTTRTTATTTTIVSSTTTILVSTTNLTNTSAVVLASDDDDGLPWWFWLLIICIIMICLYACFVAIVQTVLAARRNRESSEATQEVVPLKEDIEEERARKVAHFKDTESKVVPVEATRKAEQAAKADKDAEYGHTPAKTHLSENAEAGSKVLQVESVSGFHPGQTIEIDPDTDEMEVAEVESFGSIHLQQPLKFSHSCGAEVRAAEVEMAKKRAEEDYEEADKLAKEVAEKKTAEEEARNAEEAAKLAAELALKEAEEAEAARKAEALAKAAEEAARLEAIAKAEEAAKLAEEARLAAEEAARADEFAKAEALKRAAEEQAKAEEAAREEVKAKEAFEKAKVEEAARLEAAEREAKEAREAEEVARQAAIKAEEAAKFARSLSSDTLGAVSSVAIASVLAKQEEQAVEAEVRRAEEAARLAKVAPQWRWQEEYYRIHLLRCVPPVSYDAFGEYQRNLAEEKLRATMKGASVASISSAVAHAKKKDVSRDEVFFGEVCRRRFQAVEELQSLLAPDQEEIQWRCLSSKKMSVLRDLIRRAANDPSAVMHEVQLLLKEAGSAKC